MAAVTADHDPWAPPPDPWAPIAARREENIAAKDAASAVKMNDVNKLATGYHQKVVVPGRLHGATNHVYHVHTDAEREHWAMIAEKREDALSFRAEVRRVFTLADTDGSGQLDLAELTAARKVIGDPRAVQNAKNILDRHDHDESGTLNYDEFLQMLWTTYQKSPEGAKRILSTYVNQIGERRNRRSD